METLLESPQVIAPIITFIILLTYFLITLGISEIIDNNRNLLSEANSKKVANVIILLFLIGLLSVPVTNYEEVFLNRTIGQVHRFFFIFLGILIFLFYNLLNLKLDDILNKPSKYIPKYNRAYYIILFSRLIIIISGILLHFELNDKNFINEITRLFSKDSMGNIYGSIQFVVFLIIYYGLTVLVSGYMYNYGRIISLRKKMIIVDEPLSIKILGKGIDDTMVGVVISEDSERVIFKPDGFMPIELKREKIKVIVYVNDTQ